MGNRTVKDGRRRSTAVGVGGAVGLLTAGAVSAGLVLDRPRASSTAFDRPDIHAEYVKYLSGKDTITGYLAYPERKDPAPGVVVIHEIFGMSDFIRQTTGQLARIDAGLADVAAAVKQYAKDYHYTVYPGVGHGFLRSRERPEVADSAWRAVIRFLRESLER